MTGTKLQTVTVYCPLCSYFFEYDVQFSFVSWNGTTTIEILDGGEAMADEHVCGV